MENKCIYSTEYDVAKQLKQHFQVLRAREFKNKPDKGDDAWMLRRMVDEIL